MAKKAEEKAEEKTKKAKKAREEKDSHKAEKAKEDKAEKAKEEKPAPKEDKETGHRPEKAREDHREGKEAEKGQASEERHKPKKQKPKRGKASGREKFVELKPTEAIEAIVHLANEGHSASEIGMILRDQYAVPKIGKLTGKKLAGILQENKLLPQIPEDLMNLIRRSVVLREHLAKNKKDMSAKRGLMLTVSKIRALERYYKQAGKLPLQWRYSPEIAALLAK